MANLRSCFIALQDHEHAMYPEAPTGAAIADDYLAWMFERVERFEGAILVAETTAGEFAGFATLLARLPRTDPDDPDSEHAFLSELSVMPAFRGHGAGQVLIAASEALAKQAGSAVMRVTVVADNEGAQRLYRRAGFEPAMVMLQKNIQ